MSLPHRIPASTRITYTGRDQWTPPYTPERAQAPIASEFSGSRKLATWAALIVVAVLFWAAVTCWVVG